MQQKKPCTEAESVNKSCWKIVGDLLQGRTNALKKVQQIPLSNNTMTVQSAMTAEEIKQQFIQNTDRSTIWNLKKPWILQTMLNLYSVVGF